MLLDLLCAGLTTGCELVLPMIVREITSIATTDISRLTVRLVLSMAGIYAALKVVDMIAGYYMTYVGHCMGVKIEKDMREDMFSHLLTAPFSYFDKTKVGQLMSRITTDLFDIAEFSHHCPEEFFTLIMRRFMMEISARIAKWDGCGALITGENLGQVASQTMEAMTVTGAVVDIPIFMPLVGMDKEEIVTIARKIGTMETSILPYEDCCTVFTPKHPKTKPTLAQLLDVEKNLDREALIERALENIECIAIKYGDDPVL